MPKCPATAVCPLMAASHDARYAGFGCVDAAHIKCRAERGSDRWKLLRDALEKAIALHDTAMAGALFVALARTAGERS